MVRLAPRGRYWAEDEDATLREFYMVEDNRQLAQRLNRSEKSVSHRLAGLRLLRSPKLESHAYLDGSVGYIPLHGKYGAGKFAIVDASDFEWLMQWRWSMNPHGYVRRKASVAEQNQGAPSGLMMHRVVAGAPDGVLVDHINLMKSDNRRSNLRHCTDAENRYNQPAIKGSSSRYKGVYWELARRRWRAEIAKEGCKYNLGTFYTEESAAKAYDSAALYLFGDFALTNFSGGVPLSIEAVRRASRIYRPK